MLNMLLVQGSRRRFGLLEALADGENDFISSNRRRVVGWRRDEVQKTRLNGSQDLLVGDRLFTDVLMANMMGSHSVWIKDGTVPDHGFVSGCFYI